MTLAHDLGIVHLLEAPGAVDTLAEWFADEWAPWYGPGGEGDAEGDLAACRSRDALPICLVALSESGDVLGTASLRSESVGSELGVGPWLAAVLVPREHQGQGVGTALVAAIEAEARRSRLRVPLHIDQHRRGPAQAPRVGSLRGEPIASRTGGGLPSAARGSRSLTQRAGRVARRHRLQRWRLRST